MKNILIPIDFSKNSQSAVQYALKLYKNEVCTFYFLHSTNFINSTSRTYITPHYVEESYKKGLKKMKELELKTKRENANTKHDYKNIISNDKLHTAIDKAIKQNDIELIIMGTKGCTAAVEFFAGSNTVEVINKVKNCPVLVIPEEYSFVAPKQIGFPTDYNRKYTDRELETLKNMTTLYNSEIRIVHINVEKSLTLSQKHNIERLEKYLADQKYNFHYIDDNSKKSENIIMFINDYKIDMLAMVNYEHGPIENVLKEPVIKKLAFHPRIPLLVIPE